MKNSYELLLLTITTEERDKKEEMKNSYEQVRDYNNRGERQKGRDEKLFELLRDYNLRRDRCETITTLSSVVRGERQKGQKGDYNNRGERQKGRDEKLL